MIHRKRHEEHAFSVVYGHLPGLLAAGQVPVLHHECCLLVHLTCELGEPRLARLEQLTREEARTLVPLLLAFPTYALSAHVLAHMANSPIEDVEYQLNAAWLQGEVA